MKYLYSLPKGFDGKRITVTLDLLQTPSGTNILYETATVKNAVAVLPILDNGELILLKNHRYSIKEDILEVPAGIIDDIDSLKGGADHHTELEAAKRELKEETGYTATEWTMVGSFYTSPGWTNEKLTLFIAKKLEPGVQKLDDTEQGLTVVNTTLEKALSMIRFGAIKDMKTALLIEYYANLQTKG